MGLDSVELLVEIEKTFGIEIPDEEAEQIITVGDFYDSVWSRIKDKESDKCKSAMLFYKVRQYILEKYNLSKADFMLSSDLESIVPKMNRRDEWEVIQDEIGLKFPDLVFPSWLRKTLSSFGVITILGGLIYALISVKLFNMSAFNWLVPVCGIFLTILFTRILRPFRFVISHNIIKEFLENVLALNYKNLNITNVTNRKDMEKVMAILIHEKSGADLNKILPEAKISNDLGIN